MHINGKAFRTIWFDEKDQAVKIIDQTKLPHKFEIKNLKTVEDTINAIKTMEVRGAPLIGATAAYGIVIAIIENNDTGFIKKSCEYLIKSRPTAINLKWAVNRMIKKLLGVNNNEVLKIALDEAKLAREAEIRYSTVAMVTDFDCWHPDHENVDVQMVIKTLMKNTENAKSMIKLVIENFESKIMKNDPANNCLDTAIITNPKMMTSKTKKKLKNIAGRVLFKK